jgi:hypothetical protein
VEGGAGGGLAKRGVDHCGISCSAHPNHPKCRRVYDFIDREYAVYDAAIGGAPWPTQWLKGRDLRSVWTTQFFFADRDAVRNDAAARKYAGIGPVEALTFCLTDQISVFTVTLDKDEPLVMNTDF